jgi:hypothetical protein
LGTDNSGTRLVNQLGTAFGFDEWTADIQGGRRWFPHRLAVDIHQAPVGMRDGDTVHQVEVRIPIVRNVRSTASALNLLSELNEGAAGEALVLDEDTGVVSSEVGVVVHRGNANWINSVTKIVVMAMVDLAEQRAELLAKVLDGAVAEARHPQLGMRSQPDELLGIVGGPNWPVRDIADEPGYWDRVRRDVSAILPGPATHGPTGMSIEVPFLSEVTAAKGISTGQPAGTALLTIGTRDVLAWHEGSARVRVGSGVTFRCGLPLSIENAAMVANELNDSRPASHPHRLGAWYGRDGTVWLTLHLPSGALPADKPSQSAVITNVALGLLARARAGLEFVILRSGAAAFGAQ